MIKRTPVQLLLHHNFLGKSGFETWSEFLGQKLRHTICAVFGHAKPIYKMDAGPGGICSRCRIVLPYKK